MRIWLKERIGRPELFTGRKKELAYFLNWIDRIKREISQSTAILSRRKTGKTALLQRLYNFTFDRDDKEVPFYYEIRETDQWLGDFAADFFLNFVFQYMAFRTRNAEYLEGIERGSLRYALKIADKEGFDYVADTIRAVLDLIEEENTDRLWNVVQKAPRMTAQHYGGFAVQMIDEFQFINRFIFWDKEKMRRAKNLAGSYLHTCEYRNAPLLVTGSWVGWLMDDLNKLLPGRFIKYPMGNLQADEAAEMTFRYSLLHNIPVTEETAWLIAGLTEGSPFYINALFCSPFQDKDLSTPEGVRKTLEYESLNLDGSVNATWMDYIESAFPRINDIHAKEIVLYLSKHRDRKIGHREIREKLGLEMSDPELEKKLRALFRSDIIEEDSGCYKGVSDNIFDKVFRRSYSDDIHRFVTKEAPAENKALIERLRKDYKRLEGEYGRHKGAFAEFAITHHLSFRAHKENMSYKAMMENLPDDFRFEEYETVRSYNSPPLHDPEFQIDIFAKAAKGGYSLLGEVKNRKAKFSVKEAREFLEKARELSKLEEIGKALLFVFSVSGFHKNTLAYLKKQGIAWASDKRWLEK